LVSEPGLNGDNKERIEMLEAGLGGVQEGVQRMEMSMSGKMRQLEETINKLSEAMLSSKGESSHGNTNREGNSRSIHEENEGYRQVFSSKMAKLEFPRYSGQDPTEWFNRVDQFFEFQNTPANQKVSLASFHLEGEANQWRQWARRTYKEEGRIMTWKAFEDELWARFGPIDCEDFDEALSRIKQVGSLRDYQSEFEKLGNRVRGWTQKALVGTFMGGLKPEIAEGIHMFKPQSLKEAISLAHMKDEQMKRHRQFLRPTQVNRTPLALPTTTRATPNAPFRRLS
jgi:hypothetical protein